MIFFTKTASTATEREHLEPGTSHYRKKLSAEKWTEEKQLNKEQAKRGKAEQVETEALPTDETVTEKNTNEYTFSLSCQPAIQGDTWVAESKQCYNQRMGNRNKNLQQQQCHPSIVRKQWKDTSLEKLTGEYYNQVGASQATNGVSNTCRTILWYNADIFPTNWNSQKGTSKNARWNRNKQNHRVACFKSNGQWHPKSNRNMEIPIEVFIQKSSIFAAWDKYYEI